MGYAGLSALLEIGAPIAALFTHEDAPGETIWWRSCAELARANAIPVFAPERIGGAEIELVRASKPAVIYSFFYRNLLPEALLEIAPRGAYNLHGSLLPRYRGRAPVNWMLVNGETQGGVTLHHMVKRADAGDIVAQRAVAITDDDTALTLYRKLVPLGASLLREYHPLIAAGVAPRRPQDLSAGTYFGRRRPEDGRIDWSWAARRIHNLVRAVTHPYPGAFCYLQGRKLTVWQARVAIETGACGVPGTILESATGGAARIAAGDGVLEIRRVQTEEHGERSGAEALRAARGSRLE